MLKKINDCLKEHPLIKMCGTFGVILIIILFILSTIFQEEISRWWNDRVRPISDSSEKTNTQIFNEDVGTAIGIVNGDVFVNQNGSEQEEQKPKIKSLLDLNIASKTRFVLIHEKESVVTDIFDNSFNSGSIELQCGYSSHDPEVTYRLNGKYSQLKCTVTQTENIIDGDRLPDNISDTRLMFIGDGERLWIKVNGEETMSFPLRKNYTAPVTLEVNLKGIKELRIVKPIDRMKHRNNILLTDIELIQTDEDYNYERFDKLKDKQSEYRQDTFDFVSLGWNDFVTVSNSTCWYDALVMDYLAGEYDFILNGEYIYLKAFIMYEWYYTEIYDGKAEITFISYDKEGFEIKKETINAGTTLTPCDIDVRKVHKLTIVSEGGEKAVLVEPRLVKNGQTFWLSPS